MVQATATCICSREFSAADDDELVEVLFKHFQETDHGFKPGRVWLRNLVEALRRVDGPTERLDTIGSARVYDLTVDRLDDWLEFFDRRAFAGFRAWAACYCNDQFHPRPSVGQVEGRTWQQNRAEMIERIEQGGVWGVMGYVDGVMAGWCNASPLTWYPQYRGELDDEESTGAVVCFQVAPPYRRHGISEKLLEGALDQFRRRGMKAVVGFPFIDPDKGPGPGGDAGRFHGPLSLYEKAGFQRFREDPPRIIMRKELA